jgi:predicted phosphodiesterase
MRVAAIYDIHGNLPALEAVLADVRTADVSGIVVGGDVMPGPMPRECLERLLELDIPVQFIRGNGEREVLAQMAGVESATLPAPFREIVRWTGSQLSPEHEREVSNWPETLRVDVDGLGTVLFCHATPRSDSEIFTRLTSDDKLLPLFEGIGVRLVVCGHTHMQHDRTVGSVRVVNAGSVGMPYGEPGAYWLLLGPDIQLKHTQYDLARAADRIRRTPYPQAEVFAARSILQPPSQEEMVQALSKAALK